MSFYIKIAVLAIKCYETQNNMVKLETHKDKKVHSDGGHKDFR